MPQKISNSAVSGTEERRPITENKYRPPIAPLKVNKAELMLERLHRENPVQNIVTRRLPPTEGLPVDPNYALYIELDRLAKSSVPKQPIQPLKIKSPFTEAMIDKYKQEEERNIREIKRSGNYIDFISPPESMKPELEVPIPIDPRMENEIEMIAQEKSRLLTEYRNTQTRIDRIKTDLMNIPNLRTEPAVNLLLNTLSRGLNGIENEISLIDVRIGEMRQVEKDIQDENERIKKKNAIGIKNYEDMYRLLNKTLPIKQMAGETDEEYRERLINFKQETSNLADESEARVYEHKVFQRNLKRLINLPMFQIETLIKKLDGYVAVDGNMNRDSSVESLERVFQLNEIFPKVETLFLRTYGKDPIFRNPVETIYDFLIKVLEEPLIQEEEEDEIDIPQDIKDLSKKGLLELMKDRNAIPKGQVANYQKKRVGDLQQLYMTFVNAQRMGLS